jgi:phosphatidylserine/phosphatidylglycerophosphate/cardiolipin synthase-like enzyme
MRASLTKNGVTLRVIAGTQSAILGIDLQGNKRTGCLGFSIQRTDLGPVAKPLPEKNQTRTWLPNMLRFPKSTTGAATTELFPLQKFRWGDYTLTPASGYRFRVVPRYGAPDKLTPVGDSDGVEVEVTTEDPHAHETAVFFNRAAAASEAFNAHFPNVKTQKDLLGTSTQAQQARAWLANGLEDAILAFLAQAADDNFALHAAVYEFQKPELLAGLKAAGQRGAEVQVAFHARKAGTKDTTADKNKKAIKAATFGTAVEAKPRQADPQSAIMHNKFVVLLKKEGGELVPKAVWTGSTNWTEGALYGQLNVGHAVYDEDVAARYEKYFQLLFEDSSAPTMKDQLAELTPVSVLLPGDHKITPIFSPQSDVTMLNLYQSICDGAKCVMVSAPFAVSPIVLAALAKKRDDVLRYLLLDKLSSLGKGEEVHIIQGDPADSIAAAITLPSPLHDFQGKILEGKESFRHAGIHIHSKIILTDPFGSDPILVTGSANFSRNSTEVNDSNSLVVRGYTAVADIYATEFMRMFEHYHFRAKVAQKKAKKLEPLALAPDDTWSEKYYVSGSTEERDRRMFAGTS